MNAAKLVIHPSKHQTAAFLSRCLSFASFISSKANGIQNKPKLIKTVP